MKLKEKERIDNMARRKIGKQYGFKQSSWCNWMIKERYFFYIEHDTLAKNADLYVKPCYYDDLLWLITSEDTLKKFPDSYRANGSKEDDEGVGLLHITFFRLCAKLRISE